MFAKILVGSRRVSLKPSRRGAAVVEAALVLPIVITFLFGILEYGRYVMTLQMVTNAAREGANYALSHTQPVTIAGVTTGNATTDVTNVINTAMAGRSLYGQVTQVYTSDSLGNNLGAWTNAQDGQSVCVRITGSYPVLLGRMIALPASIPVVAQVVMRSESN
jgi:Flp pilus assembly protein TadG